MRFREKNLIIISGIIIAFAACLLLIINPLKESLTVSKSKIDEKTITLEIKKRQAENMNIIKNDLEAIKEKDQELDNMIINQDNQLKLFKDLENSALKNGLEQNFTLETPKTDTSPQKVNIDISIEGNFLSIIKYISALENFDYYIILTSIRMSSVEGNNSTSAELTAETYWK